MWLDDYKEGHSVQDYLARGGRDPEPDLVEDQKRDNTYNASVVDDHQDDDDDFEEEDEDILEDDDFEDACNHQRKSKKRKRPMKTRNACKKKKDDSSSSTEDENSRSDDDSEGKESLIRKICRKKQPEEMKKRKGMKTTKEDSDKRAASNSIGDVKEFVQKVSQLGSRLSQFKSASKRLNQVNNLDNNELNLFSTLITHLWGHGTKDSDLFELSEEDLKKFVPYRKELKDFARSRTTYKRKRAILQEGQLLKHLAELMSQLDVDDGEEKKRQVKASEIETPEEESEEEEEGLFRGKDA